MGIIHCREELNNPTSSMKKEQQFSEKKINTEKNVAIEISVPIMHLHRISSKNLYPAQCYRHT
jgi:hypothetical protein